MLFSVEVSCTWGIDEAHLDDHWRGRRRPHPRVVPVPPRGRAKHRPSTPTGRKVLDADETVLLCLHVWGADDHPTLSSPDDATPGLACCCSSASTTSRKP